MVAVVLFVSALLLFDSSYQGRRVLSIVLLSGFAGVGLEAVIQPVLSNAVRESSIIDLLPLSLHHDRWHVTLVRSDCPACRDELEQRKRVVPETDAKHALVVIGSRQSWLDEHTDRFDVELSLPTKQGVGIQTPRQMLLFDGQFIDSNGESGGHESR